MNTTKFRARFKRKYGDKPYPNDEVKDVLIPFSKLVEGKLKVKDTFVWRKESYLYNAQEVRDFDNKGRPILEYYIGNMNPIHRNYDKKPAIADEDGNLIEIDGKVWNRTFDKGEEKSVIASSQQEQKPLDWKNILFGALIGGSVGSMITFYIYPYLIHATGVG